MAAAGQLRLLLLAGLCTCSLPSVPHLAVGADRALPALREPALAETIVMPPGMRRPPPLPPAAATPGAGYARPGGVSSPIHRLNSQVWGDSSTVSRASPLSCLACSPVGIGCAWGGVDRGDQGNCGAKLLSMDIIFENPISMMMRVHSISCNDMHPFFISSSATVLLGDVM